MVEDARDAMRMTDDEIETFLAAGRQAQVATLDADGLIDLVPMSYLFWSGRLALWTDPASRKVGNLRRNPYVTCLVEAGDRFEDFRAVQLRGRAELIDDVESSRTAGELLFARYGAEPLTDEARSAAAARAPPPVVVVVHPHRVVSWDHRQLGGSPPRPSGTDAGGRRLPTHRGAARPCCACHQGARLGPPAEPACRSGPVGPPGPARLLPGPPCWPRPDAPQAPCPAIHPAIRSATWSRAPAGIRR